MKGYVTLRQIEKTSGIDYKTLWARLRARKNIETERAGVTILIRVKDVSRLTKEPRS